VFLNNILAPIRVRLSPNSVSHTLGHRLRWLNFERSRSVVEVCTLLNALLVSSAAVILQRMIQSESSLHSVYRNHLTLQTISCYPSWSADLLFIVFWQETYKEFYVQDFNVCSINSACCFWIGYRVTCQLLQTILPCDAILTRYMLSSFVCPSVCHKSALY